MIHLESISVCGKRCRFKFIFLHIDIQLFEYPLLKTLSFSHWITLTSLLKNQFTVIKRFISGQSILFLWSVCLSLFQYYSVLEKRLYSWLLNKTVLNYPVIYRFFSLNVSYSTMHDCQLAESADAKHWIWRTNYKVIHGFSSVMG